VQSHLSMALPACQALRGSRPEHAQEHGDLSGVVNDVFHASAEHHFVWIAATRYLFRQIFGGKIPNPLLQQIATPVPARNRRPQYPQLQVVVASSRKDASFAVTGKCGTGPSSTNALVRACEGFQVVFGANSSCCGLGVTPVRFWDEDSQERSMLLRSSAAIICKILESKNFSDA
jgi:hypothetical protein